MFIGCQIVNICRKTRRMSIRVRRLFHVTAFLLVFWIIIIHFIKKSRTFTWFIVKVTPIGNLQWDFRTSSFQNVSLLSNGLTSTYRHRKDTGSLKSNTHFILCQHPVLLSHLIFKVSKWIISWRPSKYERIS